MTGARDPLACPDLIAARRYTYGKAAAEDGEWATAAEMFEQAAERAPGWAPTWFALGEAREKLGDRDAAAKAFQATLAADPADAQGAAARLALIGMGAAPSALPQAYVARLFDDYAPRFDAHLTGKLHYRGPELIARALEEAAPSRRFASALDLGCGTGLMGEAIRTRVGRLEGVDLSPAMIAKARERGIFDALEAADATEYLMRSPPGTFDCIVAADTLCYFGDLKPILAVCGRALVEGGLFAFTLETFEGDGFRLQATMRFAHSPGNLDSAGAEACLHPLLVRAASTRREAGGEVPGLVCVFRKAAT